MIENNPRLNIFCNSLLVLGLLLLCFPLYYAFVAASLSPESAQNIPLPLIPETYLFENLSKAWNKAEIPVLLLNTALMALGICIGKISISLLSAFAICYFDFPFRKISFGIIFMTLMLPVEVRILPTYEVAANIFQPLEMLFNLFGLQVNLSFSLLNSYSGLILPLIASATATFLFRQFFLTVPDELCEAAKMDGASPLQFFWKILLPLSKSNIAALTVILFVYGWNQYLWPLLVTTDPSMKTAIIGIQELIPTTDEAPQWNLAMAGSLLIMIPPILVVLFMQKYFIKGLIENEK